MFEAAWRITARISEVLVRQEQGNAPLREERQGHLFAERLHGKTDVKQRVSRNDPEKTRWIRTVQNRGTRCQSHHLSLLASRTTSSAPFSMASSAASTPLAPLPMMTTLRPSSSSPSNSDECATGPRWKCSAPGMLTFLGGPQEPTVTRTASKMPSSPSLMTHLPWPPDLGSSLRAWRVTLWTWV